MKAYLKAKDPDVAQSVLDMVPLYLSEGRAEGVRGCGEYVEWLGQKEDPVGKGWAAGGASKPAPEVMGGCLLAERDVQVAGECEEMCG